MYSHLDHQTHNLYRHCSVVNRDSSKEIVTFTQKAHTCDLILFPTLCHAVPFKMISCFLPGLQVSPAEVNALPCVLCRICQPHVQPLHGASQMTQGTYSEGKEGNFSTITVQWAIWRNIRRCLPLVCSAQTTMGCASLFFKGLQK